MLTKTTNHLVLQVFEAAAQGTLPLLNFLQSLFSSTRISFSQDDAARANQALDNANQTVHPSYAASNISPPDIHLSDRDPCQFTLTIHEEQCISLNVHFGHQEKLKQCLESEVFLELLPYLKQALIIADQISEQQADIYSIDYVMSKHPWLACNTSDEKATHSIDVDREQLRSLFELSPSEAELTKLLVNGFSLQNIAEHRCVSKQTIRKQLQSILKKAECDSQEKLIMTVFNALLAHLPPTKAPNDTSIMELR